MKNLIAVFHIPSKAVLVKKGEHFFHMTYLGAVSWSAHGAYAYAAQVLLVFTVLGVFIRDETHHV